MGEAPTPRCTLFPTVSEKDSGFYIIWYRLRWTRTSKERNSPNYFPIKKGNQHQYNLDSLKRWCAGWEVDEVVEYELKFAAIRKTVRALQQAKMYLKLSMSSGFDLSVLDALEEYEGDEDDSADV